MFFGKKAGFKKSWKVNDDTENGDNEEVFEDSVVDICRSGHFSVDERFANSGISETRLHMVYGKKLRSTVLLCFLYIFKLRLVASMGCFVIPQLLKLVLLQNSECRLHVVA